jgi:hypothetical protein
MWPAAWARSVSTMARKLDARQQEELSSFVDALAEIGGFSSTAEWARESGYDRSALSDLRNRNGAIDGYNLLRLIRVAATRARLDPEHLALLAERVGVEADDAIDAAIIGRLDELARQISLLQETTVEALSEGRGSVQEAIRAAEEAARGAEALAGRQPPSLEQRKPA